MAVAVATRFKLSSGRHLPKFFRGTAAAALQARRSPGFMTGRLRIDSGGAYWTLTLWESEPDMVRFRDSGAHAELVPKLAGWASEAVFGVWNTDLKSVPSWAEVNRRVAQHPHFASLDAPAPSHLAKRLDYSSKLGLVLPIPRGRGTHP